MTGRSWWLAAVRLSQSFGDAFDRLAAELGAGVLDWHPEGAEPVPPGATVVVILAGGAESDAVELMAALALGEVPVFVVGAATEYRLVTAAMQRGARDYFALPDDFDLLRRSLEREAREAGGRSAAIRFAESERRATGLDTILGRSPALREVLDQAARVATHRDVTVLIGGETGTGKELLARAIHYHSPRAAEPFVEINCAAIPAALLESELFGHEKGAFTGAVAAKPGLFELAHGGTLFLDEIGSLPLELQPKLLRALESRTIRRVGGQQSREVDVRVLAATHVDLAAAAGRGEFREDLYYRLNVIRLVLPALRHRGDDAELLVETFATRLATSYGLPVPPITPEVRAVIRSYHWPGNVRELRNAVERALVLSPPGTLRADEFRTPQAPGGSGGSGIPFPAELDTIIRHAAQAMLALTGGNKSEAARRLGISRPRLQRLLDGEADREQANPTDT